MTKPKLAVVAGISAAAIGVASLGVAPSASAMPMSCSQAMAMAARYKALGDIALNVFDNPAQATWYYGKADGLIEAAC
jgi:hypothetical protein